APLAARRRVSRWWLAFVIIGSLVGLLGIASLLIRVPYATIAPGSARQVNSLVVVTGHEVYPPKGKVLFTTVGVQDHVSAMQAIIGWLDPTVDVISEKTLRGTIPADRYQQLNVEAMADSKTSAEELVLRRLGYTDLGVGAHIHDIDPTLPAASVLKLKDLIVAVDATPVTTSAEAANAIRAHQPGESITVTVVRDGAPPTDYSAVLAKGDEGQPLLGVRMTTQIKLPFGIDIDSGNVEGPSAGLAYSLALLDELTPGELTGGRKVAVTGELRADGKVGPIGGVAQKAVAVRRAGAKLFLVPRDNFAEAKRHAGDGLEVRAVDSFDQALEVLGSFEGSNALALAHPGGGAGS
ncbi:MAG TPA: S16 family serine protease, partial [Acidimicrobiales bacterium]|nr:S16 family serine protease [Acidimicrobiales bacterium]